MEMLCYVRTECDPIHVAFRSVSAHVQAKKEFLIVSCKMLK